MSFSVRYFDFGISPCPQLHTPLSPPSTENRLLTPRLAVHTTEQFQQFTPGGAGGAALKKAASPRKQTVCGLCIQRCSGVLSLATPFIPAGPGSVSSSPWRGRGRGGGMTRVALKTLQDPLIHKLKCLHHLNCGAMEHNSDF